MQIGCMEIANKLSSANPNNVRVIACGDFHPYKLLDWILNNRIALIGLDLE